jgi:ubiquinone/menaquinone biosynthesis C-methylase UbiE
MHNHMPPGAGRTSFDLIDSAGFFEELGLQTGMVFLDLGCGRGHFALASSRRVGERGMILGVDLWAEGIVDLAREANSRGIHRLHALRADLGKGVPIRDQAIDVCLLATVLHDLVQSSSAHGALGEVVRVLKPQGLLAVLEYRKVEGPPGPPLPIRMAPGQVEDLVASYGLIKRSLKEIGPYHYLLTFAATKNP